MVFVVCTDIRGVLVSVVVVVVVEFVITVDIFVFVNIVWPRNLSLEYDQNQVGNN